MRSLEEPVPQATRVVEVHVHRRSRQTKAAVREQRVFAGVLVASPAAHLRADRRGLVPKRDRGKPHEKCQGWDGCDEANVGREPADVQPRRRGSSLLNLALLTLMANGMTEQP